MDLPSPFISTLCRGLDSLLGGGVQRGDVTLFFGSRGVGKTCLTLQAAISNSLQGLETFFIFCQGTFPTSRLAQIAAGGIDEISRLIHVATPVSFRNQHRLLERSELELHRRPTISLLIIDSIDSLNTLELSLLDSVERRRHIYERSFFLNKHLGLLRNISRSRNVASIITCGVRSFQGSSLEEPVSPRLMEYWPDSIVELSKGPSRLFFKPVKIRGRNSSIVEQDCLSYQINAKGIVDSPQDGGEMIAD